MPETWVELAPICKVRCVQNETLGRVDDVAPGHSFADLVEQDGLARVVRLVLDHMGKDPAKGHRSPFGRFDVIDRPERLDAFESTNSDLVEDVVVVGNRLRWRSWPASRILFDLCAHVEFEFLGGDRAAEADFLDPVSFDLSDMEEDSADTVPVGHGLPGDQFGVRVPKFLAPFAGPVLEGCKQCSIFLRIVRKGSDIIERTTHSGLSRELTHRSRLDWVPEDSYAEL